VSLKEQAEKIAVGACVISDACSCIDHLSSIAGVFWGCSCSPGSILGCPCSQPFRQCLPCVLSCLVLQH